MPTTLPKLEWHPTLACSARRPGSHIAMVVVHRWGVADWQHERIDGVVRYFKDPAHQVSSHLVYAGEQGPDRGRCVQMVALADKAWTEAAFNSVGVSIESSDRIWLAGDDAGLARLARITAYLLHRFKLPAVDLETAKQVLNGRGFTRHGALGANGGGHPFCPTSSPRDPRWRRFATLVEQETARGGFRRSWAR